MNTPIEGFSRYYITEDNQIYDTKLNKLIIPFKLIGKSTICVSLRSDKGKRSNLTVGSLIHKYKTVPAFIKDGAYIPETIVSELQKEIIDTFLYNPATGELINRLRHSTGYVDTTTGYMCHSFKYKHVFDHRLIYIYMTGVVPDEIDHINHNRLDNIWKNLRNITKEHNTKNKSKPKNNTTGFVGVFKDSRNKKWYARIYINKKPVHIGVFETAEEAAIARKKALIDAGYHVNHH